MPEHLGLTHLENPADVDVAPQEPPPAPPERQQGFRLPPLSPRVRRVLIATDCLFALCAILFGFLYFKFARLTDEKLRTGVFAGSLDVFAQPRTVAVGDRFSSQEIIAALREGGYGTAEGNAVGWYRMQANSIAIFPGRGSSLAGEPVTLFFSGDQVSRIVSLDDNTTRQECQLAPRLITNLSEHSREKRRMVRFSEIPPALVHAVVSAEDKHFFSHSGFDLFRIFKAAYVDVKAGKKEQGASTLSMQLARGLWLDPDKNWKRKAEEFLITMHLEHKLTKQEIFEYYANQVYLGRSGTFSIHGFGEAAHAYFAKDISQLSVPESALLAGMIQRPSYFNPFRYPDRAKERRDLVLLMMRENGYLTSEAYANAAAAPIQVKADGGESLSFQYFLDMASDELQSRLGDRDPQSFYVYTTLDMNLQNAATEAVRLGMANVDAQLQKGKRRNGLPPALPQVALIALDPHTGEVKALVGGRDYGASQLNHITAERQPGSAFKPFVYAAALNTAAEGGATIITPATTVVDEPTTFTFENQRYQPGNFEHNFMGTVTLRQALAHSLNVAAIKVAQMVGYPAVVEMARRAGLNDHIKATPAVALGAYEATPMEIAAAYTLFANGGMYVAPDMIGVVRSHEGDMLYQHSPDTRRALDPRVNYLMVSMLEEVLRSGTGAGVRARGFTVPAAGKTGTSRDGWFAGFTSRLLCVVWVGFDDNRELSLEGAKSALPIWTEFMKRALQYRPYRDATEFPPPSGVSSVKLCSASRQLATPDCPSTYQEYFVDGSQPVVSCPLHSGAAGQDDDNGNAPIVALPEDDSPAPQKAPRGPSLLDPPATPAPTQPDNPQN